MLRFQKKLAAGRVLYQYWGNASNCYLLVDSDLDATCLIDCGMPSDIPSLLNLLRDLPPLSRVVCTHFHVDHLSGWVQLKEVCPDTEIWFHEKARPLVTGQATVPFPGVRALKEILFPCMREYGYKPDLRDAFRGALFGTPFKRGFPLERLKYFSGADTVLDGFTTLHTPGHRPDETSFWDPGSGVFISGDFIVVLDGKIMSNTFVSSSEDQYASLEKIKKLTPIRFICPGHGHVRPFSAQDI